MADANPAGRKKAAPRKSQAEIRAEGQEREAQEVAAAAPEGVEVEKDEELEAARVASPGAVVYRTANGNLIINQGR